MVPRHEDIVDAIAPLQDIELQVWTRTADSYTLDPTAPPLPGHRAWVLGPSGVRSPVGVLLVRDPRGRLSVPTEQASTVARLLASCGRLPPKALAERFLALWQVPTRPAQVVPGSERLESIAGGFRLSFRTVGPRVDASTWAVDLGDDDLRVVIS